MLPSIDSACRIAISDVVQVTEWGGGHVVVADCRTSKNILVPSLEGEKRKRKRTELWNKLVVISGAPMTPVVKG